MTTTPGTATARRNTWARIAALLVTIVLLTGLAYLRVSSSPDTSRSRRGRTQASRPCTRAPIQPRTAPTAPTAERSLPEDRADPRPRLIALR